MDPSGSLFTDAERIITILALLLGDPDRPSLTGPAATADHRADTAGTRCLPRSVATCGPWPSIMLTDSSRQ